MSTQNPTPVPNTEYTTSSKCCIFNDLFSIYILKMFTHKTYTLPLHYHTSYFWNNFLEKNRNSCKFHMENIKVDFIEIDSSYSITPQAIHNFLPELLKLFITTSRGAHLSPDSLKIFLLEDKVERNYATNCHCYHIKSTS